MSEPYIGDEMVHCPLKAADFNHTCAVIVSGDGINGCGHALLHVGNGWYFHVAGLHNLPRFMSEDGYMRYLRENGKREYRRWIVNLTDPAKAHQRLEELLSKKWRWLAVRDNCVSFVEEVVKAGGSSAGMYFNCPTLEPFA